MGGAETEISFSTKKYFARVRLVSTPSPFAALPAH